MSGIINSAGSRSGIIGETELDYEIGEWTPALANPSGASFSADTGEYVKIGNAVFVRAQVTYASTHTNNSSISGLPFTTGGSGAYTFPVQMQNLNWDSGTAVFMYVPNGNTIMSFNFISDDSGWTSGYAAASGDIFYLTGTYFVNPPSGVGGW